MIVEQWWNSSDRGKLKYPEISLLTSHKSHIDWPEIEPEPPSWEAGE
jgi:hypothetical protein